MRLFHLLLSYLHATPTFTDEDFLNSNKKREALMYQPERTNELMETRSQNLKEKKNSIFRMGGLQKIVTLDKEDKESLVNAVNLRRAGVIPKPANMKYIEWDDSLAETAAVHAKRCQFAHSTSEQLYHPVWRHQIGENLAVFRGPKTFVNDLFVWIVDGFYEERKYYDYETSQCTAQCGHYEVLVHADQERMGCAVATCDSVVDAFKKLHRTELGDSPYFIVVCHYAPVTLTPTLYEKGKPCSMCDRGWDFCTAGLCSQKVEPEIKRIVGGLRVDAGMTDLTSTKDIYKWSDWSACTRSCGTGIKWRFRMCEGCKGPEGEMKMCMLSSCQNSGGWNEWNSWSACSETCGSNGQRERTRSCQTGQIGVALCSGSTAQFQTCSLPGCSQWMSWQNWSSCTVTCGTGTKRRTRKCDKKGSDNCVGSVSESDYCSPDICGGRWNFWSTWSDCSVTCGTGRQERSRRCTGGRAGQGFCMGNTKSVKECNAGICGGAAKMATTLNGNCEYDGKTLKCNNAGFDALPVFSAQFSDRNTGKNTLLKGAKSIDFSNNTISELSALGMACKLLNGKGKMGKADTINLSNNKITSISSDAFKSCSQIQTLRITGNPLRSIAGDSFMHMKRLGRVIMSKPDTGCWSTEDVMSLLQAAVKFRFKLIFED